MLRRFLTAVLVALMLAGTAPLAWAQEGDQAYFEAFEGLQRIVARNWMAPLTVIETEEVQMLDEQGTPMAGWRTEPLATPEPVTTAVGQLTIFIYLFDSDEHSASGFERIDDEIRETTRRDPRAPMTDEVPLEGIGDRAAGYMGELTEDGVDVTYAFATVQGGPFVYQLFSVTAGMDAAGLMQDTADMLVGQPMNRMAEQYDREGGSRGGLWSKFDSVKPDMPEDSEVVDLVIYPMPEETPEASPVSEFPRLDLDDPTSIAGLASIDHVRYTTGGKATPAASGSGVFRIDAWILTFDAAPAAHEASDALNTTLTEPFGMFSGGSTSTGSWERVPTYSAWSEGFIMDRSSPAGEGVVRVEQQGTRLVGVAIYAVDGEPRAVGDEVVAALMERGFPEAGDPSLQGLEPVEEGMATPAM